MVCIQLLPEYSLAHERAVYKTVAIVADTKKIVQNINLESLSELRAMQKPVVDIEDLLAAVIVICKMSQSVAGKFLLCYVIEIGKILIKFK